MSYTELLDRFWAMEIELSDKEKLLYLYLLHRCNNLGWPDKFSLSNDEIVGKLRCRPTVMKEARKSLIDAGLITYDAGLGRGNSSFYSIVAEKGRNGNPFSTIKGSEREPFYEAEKGRNGNPFIEEDSSKSSVYENGAEIKGSEREPFYEAEKEKQNKEEKNNPPAPPVKKKKEKEKEITQSKLCSTQDKRRVRTRVSDNGQEEIVFKDVEKEVKEKLNRKPEPPQPNLPGSLEEVIAFFEKNAADKLPDWREEAEAFFYHYESYGWNGTSNRKILDWESKANLWICDKAIKHKQTKNNHATTTNNNTSNDRAASDREAQELVARLLRENRIEDEGVPRYVQP